MAQKLKFGNGTWATKEGSTLAYNDENNNYKPLPFTTTRNSIATRVNKQGLIEVVGNDVPRIDYTDSADGVLLLEPQSANLITHSIDLTNSSWVKTGTGTGSTPSVTSNYSVSPDGTQNADRVIFDLNGGTANGDISQVSVTFGSVSSASYTNSVYIKSNTANDYDLVVADPSGGNVVKTITPQWQRFDNSRTSVTNLSIRIRLRGDESTSDYADVSIWGAQVEQNSYPTSYIPTSGSSVTRQADTANGSGNSEVFNGLQGVLMAEISALDSNPNTYRAIYLNDTNATRYVGMRYGLGSNLIQILGFDGSNFVSQNFTLLDSKLNTKISVKYSSEGLVIWVNGFKLSTLSGFTGMGANDLNELVFRSNNLQPFYGKTKEIGYYDAVLTDSELEYLTSYRSLSELVTELNLNTL